MQTYRQFPQQTPQRSPHTNAAAGRRGIGPMIGAPPGAAQPPITPAQMEAQRQAKTAAEGLARHSKIPVDRNLPDGVDQCIIGDGAQRFKDLKDVERRLDATMMRKRLDVQDAMSRVPKRYRTLRIWISNTVEDQPWQADGLDVDAFDFSTNQDSSYRVKIEGRLLDDPDDLEDSDDSDDEEDESGDPMDEDNKEKVKKTKPKKQYRLSHFFKSMTVDFDRQKAKDGSDQTVEWKKPNVSPTAKNIPDAADFDSLEFKRGGDENSNITINLVRYEDPERFQLSPALADILDTTEATRGEVLMGIWQYVKAMGLQEDDEKRSFRCDDLLKKVTNRDTGYVPYIADQIISHMTPLPPVKLAYTIRVDQEFHKSPTPTIYDVRVLLDDPLRAALKNIFSNPNYPKTIDEINSLNTDIAYHIQAITLSKSKHTFLTAFSKDPANFVRKWMSSQKRDLDVIIGEGARGAAGENNGEEWRRGGPGSLWQSENVRESVNLLLTRPR